MGIHRGPNTVKDGLVFGYDTGYGIADNDTATRFYPGRPTTNYLSSGVSGYNVVQGAAWHGATPSYTLGTSEFGTPIGTYNVGGSNYMYSYDQVLDDDLSTLSSQTVTFSIYLKRDGVDSNVRIRIYDNVSGYTYSTKSVTSKFSRYTMTKTLGANPTRIFVMIDNTGGGLIDFHSPQLEIGDVSPFVDGTRSATASLIDLKRATNIDISNVSFDSTGQPIFDGTDDIIDLTLPQNFQDKLTIETWYKGTDSSRNHLWNFTGSSNLNCNFNDGSYTLWLYWDGSGGNYLRFTTPQFCDSEIHHIVFVHEGSTNKVYLDGVLLTNGVAGGTQTFNSKIGSTYDIGGSPYFQGDVYVNRVYAKALTASQVQQNYNAYKNRFDI